MPTIKNHAPRRALAGLAISALGAITAIAAAGLYAEAMRAPDQP